MWLWHGDLYRVSPFQAYRTSTSCLPRDLEFFMLAVMKTFVTDISASTGRNDFIPPLVERGLYCNHLVRPSVCPSVHFFVTDISASTGRNDFIFDIQ